MTNAKAWQAIGLVIPVLEQGFRIKEKRISVYPDFAADKTEVEADAWIRLRIGGVLLTLLRCGCKALGILIRGKLSGKKKAPAERTDEQNKELPAADGSGREIA